MQPILKIDLTTGKTEEYQIPEKWEKDFLGGASLAARILYSTLTRELDPLSPEGPLLFMTGPLTGTSGPTTGRFVICGKGPATGLWARHGGGLHPVQLRAGRLHHRRAARTRAYHLERGGYLRVFSAG